MGSALHETTEGHTLTCRGEHTGGHRLMINGQPGTVGRSFAEFARHALNFCDEAVSERYGAAAGAVLDRADAVRGNYPGNWWAPRDNAHYEIEVSYADWVALAECLGSAADYMVTNSYATDEYSPEDAACARVFTDVHGRASLGVLKFCWV